MKAPTLSIREICHTDPRSSTDPAAAAKLRATQKAWQAADALGITSICWATPTASTSRERPRRRRLRRARSAPRSGVLVEPSGDIATIWLLIDDTSEFEEYQVGFVREQGVWNDAGGSGGFQTGTPSQSVEWPAKLGAELREAAQDDPGGEPVGPLFLCRRTGANSRASVSGSDLIKAAASLWPPSR